jgi:predicted house-cleaning NTP pyrophosphatase (Maf/HAM1 superfamily)
MRLGHDVAASHALSRLTRTGVLMRDYTDAEIEAYIATGDPFDKAGSYAIQHPVFKPVARIDGCYTNVVGLPMCTLKPMLTQLEPADRRSTTECQCRGEYQTLFLEG